MADTQTLERTPLHALHVSLGAKMVAFADYDMPVQYAAGVLKEHLHTRASAGLFDVSHMGQVRISGDDPAAALESLVAGDLKALQPGEMRYTLFTNEAGGILDDLMVTNAGDHLFVVVNAACKAQDIALMQRGLDGKATVEPLPDRALIAVQGPKAAEAVGRLAPASAELYFMQGAAMPVSGVDCFVTRSGYTGEDGFEIVASTEAGTALWDELMSQKVQPCGLGARDSLRLEAALALYGNDIDTSTNPWEAGLGWVLSLDDDDFVGKEAVLAARERGVERQLVCLSALAPGVIRSGCDILRGRERVGRVTSGGFSPTLGLSIAMGYLPSELASDGTQVEVDVRGRPLLAQVVPRPFYRRRKVA